MLDKKDLNKIEEISEKVSKRVVTDALVEFWTHIVAPCLDKEHKEQQRQHKEIIEKLDDKFDSLAEYIKDHEKRITKLESVVTP